MILEGLLSTCDPEGRPHLAAMGAELDDDAWETPRQIVLRPYQSSATFRYLRRSGRCLFHVTDDAALIARVVVGSLDSPPAYRQRAQTAESGAAAETDWVLADACRWHALAVRHWDESQPRAVAFCEVLASERQREFLGFNRGKHAVLEAAILATRVTMLPMRQIQAEIERLRPLVEKTAAQPDREAFAMLERFIAQHQEAHR